MVKLNSIGSSNELNHSFGFKKVPLVARITLKSVWWKSSESEVLTARISRDNLLTFSSRLLGRSEW